eukprot:359206-Chlamydomonas_euryale.AAC.1
MQLTWSVTARTCHRPGHHHEVASAPLRHPTSLDAQRRTASQLGASGSSSRCALTQAAPRIQVASLQRCLPDRGQDRSSPARLRDVSSRKSLARPRKLEDAAKCAWWGLRGGVTRPDARRLYKKA